MLPVFVGPFDFQQLSDRIKLAIPVGVLQSLDPVRNSIQAVKGVKQPLGRIELNVQLFYSSWDRWISSR